MRANDDIIRATAAQARNGHAAPSDDGVDLWVSPERIDRPRISLIIPALNEEKLIVRTLECFPRAALLRCGAELIVSDGGSRDRTTEICREWADVIATHTAPRRQTIAEGRNLGAAQARGELLVFINGDTVPQVPGEFLEALVALVDEEEGKGEKGKEEGSRVGMSLETSPGRRRRSGTRPIVAWACPVAIAPGERRLSDRLFHGFFNSYVRFLNAIGLGMGRGECQVVRRDVFEKVGGYHAHMAAGEDFDLYRRLTEHGAIGHVAALRVYESPRRFRRFGYVRVLFEWTLNGMAVMILGRSIAKEWEEIR